MRIVLGESCCSMKAMVMGGACIAVVELEILFDCCYVFLGGLCIGGWGRMANKMERLGYIG